MKILFWCAYLFLLTAAISAQDDLRVTGNQLTGKRINGEQVREVTGNVKIYQGDVVINCNKAIQFFTQNKVELIGDVVINQNNTNIYTEEGIYYGKTKTAFSDAGIKMFREGTELTADTGYYYFDDELAEFFGNVNLIDSGMTLNSKNLDYFSKEEKAVAVGMVTVRDSASVLNTDSLIYYDKKDITYAYKNVEIYNKEDKLRIFGDALTDIDSLNYTKVSGNTLLMQEDTAASGKIDTLLIAAGFMESYSDSSKKLIAIDSVKIIRGDFSSVNIRTEYYYDEERIFTVKAPNELKPPVLWYENSQLVGDTVNIYLKDRALKLIDIVQNSFILSKHEKYEYRYDQISGDTIKMFFETGDLIRTEVYGNMLSIYYNYDEGKPNGLIKSSAEDAKIYFEDNSAEQVNMYGQPISEYHPENTVNGKELDFTLPMFIIYENRPKKENLLERINRKSYGRTVTAEK